MRIAMFTDYFHPELGGIQDTLIVMAKELVRRGDCIDIYAPRYSADDYARSAASHAEVDVLPGVKIIRLPSLHLRGPTQQSRIAIPAGWRQLRLASPDVVHVHTFLTVAACGLVAARILHRPLVI